LADFKVLADDKVLADEMAPGWPPGSARRAPLTRAENLISYME
jgi:hypothetical protein